MDEDDDHEKRVDQNALDKEEEKKTEPHSEEPAQEPARDLPNHWTPKTTRSRSQEHRFASH